MCFAVVVPFLSVFDAALTPTPVPVTMAPTLALKSVPTAATVATAAPITGAPCVSMVRKYS